MPLFKSLNLLTINTRQYQVCSINSILMEGFSSNWTQMFTTTRQCAEPILPLYQLCQGHWWGYKSHSVIVLVYTGVCRIHLSSIVKKLKLYIILVKIYRHSIFKTTYLNNQSTKLILCLCNALLELGGKRQSILGEIFSFLIIHHKLKLLKVFLISHNGISNSLLVLGNRNL